VQTPVSLFTSAPAASDQSASAQAEKQTVPLVDVQQPADLERESAAVISGQSVSETGLSDLAMKASTCRLCGLAETRTKVVFGTGSPTADLLFVGEAPGHDEDLKGEPFVGEAGLLLDRMLAATGMDRNQVYIMNTVKCRPPNNRDPRADEVQACRLWFDQQLELLQPKMICLLGRVAAQTVLGSDESLGTLRGRWHDYHGIPVWVTYHPGYLLRSPRQKQKSWQDLQGLLARFKVLSI